MASTFNLNDGQRAERKLLITVAEWKDSNGDITIGTGSDAYKVSREILGTRTEDSSIEYNADIETTTDIRGINYTDVNRTQPQQDFDPFLILGGSKLGALLNDIRKRNAVSELNAFTVYVITAFVGDSTSGYEAEKHDNCTIAYNSIGGDSNVNMPISVYLSNDGLDQNGKSTGAPATGTVNKLTYDFEFSFDVTV